MVIKVEEIVLCRINEIKIANKIIIIPSSNREVCHARVLRKLPPRDIMAIVGNKDIIDRQVVNPMM